MKLFKKLIIPFCALLIFVLAIILVPIIGKSSNKNKKNFGYVISCFNKVDEKTIEDSTNNRFIMYIDYESDKLEEYKRYIDLEFKLYLSIYSLTDFDNYNKELFKGVFIKNLDNKDQLIEKAKSYKKTDIVLLTNNISDYDKYKKDVESFVFTSDVISEAYKRITSAYIYKYVETTPEKKQEDLLAYYSNFRKNKEKYGLVLYVVK